MYSSCFWRSRLFACFLICDCVLIWCVVYLEFWVKVAFGVLVLRCCYNGWWFGGLGRFLIIVVLNVLPARWLVVCFGLVGFASVWLWFIRFGCYDCVGCSWFWFLVVVVWSALGLFWWCFGVVVGACVTMFVLWLRLFRLVYLGMFGLVVWLFLVPGRCVWVAVRSVWQFTDLWFGLFRYGLSGCLFWVWF